MFTNILFKQSFLASKRYFYLECNMLICIYNEEIDLSCDETVLILEKIFILKILSLLLLFFLSLLRYAIIISFLKIFLVTHLQKNILCHIGRKSETWQRFVSGFVTWMIYNDMQIFFQPSTDKRFSRLIAADIRP